MASFVSRFRKQISDRRLLPLALLLILSSSGCTDPATRNQLDTETKSATKGLEEATHPQLPPKRYNPLVVSDKIWTGSTAVRMHRGLPLPDKFESNHGITIVSSKPMALDEIASAITEQTGVPVNVADAPKVAAAAAPSPVNTGNASPISAAPSNNGMMLAYEGPLSGLLERVASNYGVSWRFDGSSISIKRFETRVFTIEALPGTSEIAEGMQDDTATAGASGGGGGSSATSTITQNSKFAINFKYWDELGQVLTSMLGGTGTVVISPSIGTVTVTTTPDVMRTVADYLAQENQRLSRQIAVNVEIYTVSLQEGLDFNIAFKTALKSLSNVGGNITASVTPPAEQSIFGGLQTTSGATTQSNAGSLSVAILNPNTTGQLLDTFSALSAIGDTTKVARFPLITLNNRPVSRRVGNDIAYLASSTTTASVTAGVAPTVTLTPGTVHQGFSVQLTPRLLDDGRILLQYSLSIIDLIGLSSFSSAGSSIQTPTTSNRIFVQQSVLKSGSMLVLGGADEQDAAQNSEGVGDPFNYILGGGSSNARTHTMVFFALTPQVVDAPHTEQD